jgi:hypothetical protein
MSGDYDNETVSPAYTQPDFTIKGLFVIIIIISIGYLWGVAMGTGIFYDKLRPQILLVGTTANVALRMVEEHHCKTNFLIAFIIFSFC